MSDVIAGSLKLELASLLLLFSSGSARLAKLSFFFSIHTHAHTQRKANAVLYILQQASFFLIYQKCVLFVVGKANMVFILKYTKTRIIFTASLPADRAELLDD